MTNDRKVGDIKNVNCIYKDFDELKWAFEPFIRIAKESAEHNRIRVEAMRDTIDKLRKLKMILSVESEGQ